MRTAHGFKVFQNAAVELKNMIKARFLHVNSRFLAANAAGAKAHHGFSRQVGLMVQQRCREVCELADAPVDCIGEGAHVHFKSVARVQRDHRAARVVMALVQPALQGGRVHCWRAASGRANRRMVHADDLGLDLDQQLFKRLVRGPALLDVQVGKPRISKQPGHKAGDLRCAARQK